MARTTIQPEYFDILKRYYGTHVAVADRLGITRIWYMRLRNQSDKYKPSRTLHNAIISLVHSVKLEMELVTRNDQNT